jgi:hypothetical protein
VALDRGRTVRTTEEKLAALTEVVRLLVESAGHQADCDLVVNPNDGRWDYSYPYECNCGLRRMQQKALDLLEKGE